MCGICGFFDPSGQLRDAAAVARMSEALRHRGPDDSGEFFDAGLGFGFRRLSILDLELGHQPMSSPDGRFTAVFNGEIYNHLDLRPALEKEGRRFKTHSDTETLLAAFERRGTAAFASFNGMFACAVWDRQERTLTLARDPLGVKPLYYVWSGGRFYFASEVLPLAAAGLAGELDPAAVRDYLESGYVHAPDSILAGVKKFPAGHWMRLGPGGASEVQRFWSLPRPEALLKIEEREALERLRALLEAAVRRQCLSDVPVGVFLSGGVDSSLVAALMARRDAGPLETFSVAFEDAGRGVDESPYARRVARFLGTRHHEVRLGPRALDDLETMAACMDQPVSDAAILATWHLTLKARERVKVVLTGEGGDEVFAGYSEYKAPALAESLDKLPQVLRPAAYLLARHLGGGGAFRRLPIRDAAAWNEVKVGRREAGVSRLLREASMDGRRSWLEPLKHLSGLSGFMAFDLQTALADQMLLKLDMTLMRGSLEGRVPLLDLELVDFAFRLPSSLRIRDFHGKYLLRKAAEDLLPPGIPWRRKHGFRVPIQRWIAARENTVAADALRDGAFLGTGLFDGAALERALKDVRESAPGADPMLVFRAVLLSVWNRRLRAVARS